MTAPFVSVGAMTATISTTNGDNAIRVEDRQLPTEMLERFRARAGDLDRTNAYFEEDLAELRAIGYLAAAVPTELGGWGLDLAELAASQRRLARYAPATALAVTMHSYWIGIAVELEKAGLKMPEGPHRYVESGAVAQRLRKRGFSIRERSTRLLVPAQLAGLGPVLSRAGGGLPLLRSLGVIQLVVAARDRT